MLGLANHAIKKMLLAARPHIGPGLFDKLLIRSKPALAIVDRELARSHLAFALLELGAIARDLFIVLGRSLS